MDLRRSSVALVWPDGIRPCSFADGERPAEAHDLLSKSYSVGGGHVAVFEQWWPSVRDDPEYNPALFLIAVDGSERVVGVAHCWTTAFLKDLAVAQHCRRRGLGQALLLHAVECFRQRGASSLDLKVIVGNPSGAERLYRRVGMKPLNHAGSHGAV